MRIGLAAAVVVALTTGCGGAPAARVSREPAAQVAASPTSVPVPPLRLPFRDLVAAIPLASDLFPWRVQIRCLTTKARCGHFLEGRGALLVADGATSQEVDEDLMIATFRWPTAHDAEETVASLRRGYQDQVGRFATRAHRTSSPGYIMGTKGRGDLTPLSRGAWTGWRQTARLRLVHLDGRRTKVADLVELVLTRDRITVHVRVSTWLPRRGDSSAQIAEEQLTALIAALEQRGAAG
jgi:hypothetical protein